jgi:hypothetical protein
VRGEVQVEKRGGSKRRGQIARKRNSTPCVGGV